MMTLMLMIMATICIGAGREGGSGVELEGRGGEWS